MTSRRTNALDARRTNYLDALGAIINPPKRNGRSTGGTLQPPAQRFWHLVRTYRAIAAASQKTFDVAATLAGRHGDSSDYVLNGVIFLAREHPEKATYNRSFGNALNALMPNNHDEIFLLLKELAEIDKNAANIAANTSMGPVFRSLIRHGDAQKVEELFIDIVVRNLSLAMKNPQTPWVIESLANQGLLSGAYAIFGGIDYRYLETLIVENNHWQKAVVAVGRSLGLKTAGKQAVRDLADLFSDVGNALKEQGPIESPVTQR
ncbi:MAG TPA: hypothetical protein PKB15_07065 [Acidimicrobiia bacterium]|nr:hypothetical protein [Acidimicrobiia bacterium]